MVYMQNDTPLQSIKMLTRLQMSEELQQANLITIEIKEKQTSDTEQSGTLIIKNC